MTTTSRIASTVCLTLSLGLAWRTEGQPALSIATQKGAAVTTHAKGTFDVKVDSLARDEKVRGLAVGRFSLDKRFIGDLVGSSKGEMTTVGTSVEGGYIAVEHFVGTLNGRSGEFTLLHLGTARPGGEVDLTITVVPGSGAGQLAGLRGRMVMTVADGKHFYDLEHTLFEVPAPDRQ